ncbi:hypothetical protein, partial [Rothia nasimurium]|uniref:hypothetical protein n=3 Tax=Rothia TaxID=32207 RepID=UPI001C5AB119
VLPGPSVVGRRAVGGVADAAADSGGRSATRALNDRVLEGEVLPPSGAVVSVGQRAIGPGVYGTLPELMPAEQKLQNLSPSPLTSSQIDDYLGGMKERGVFHKSSKYEQWNMPGGSETLDKDFTHLAQGLEYREISIKGQNSRIAQLSDDTKIIQRPSSEGSPTLELQRPSGSKNLKFRYPDE